MEKRPRKILVTVLALVALLSLAACGQSASGSDSGRKLQQVSLLISYQDGPVFYSFSVARKMGYFRTEGLDVKVIPTQGSSYVTQEVITGHATYGMANGPADIIAYSKDASLRVPSCFQEKLIYEIGELRGGPIKSVSDLKGKTLGYTAVGSGEVPYADAVLHKAGLVPGQDVKMIPIGDGTAQTMRALQTHQVDAYISESTEFDLMSLKGLHFSYIKLSQYEDAPESCFVTTQAALQNPKARKILIGIARAFTEGTVFGIANPAAAAKIVCSDLPQTCLDKSTAETQVKDTVALATPYTPSVRPGGIDLKGWQEAEEVSREAGEISKDVNVTGLVATPLVKSVTSQILDFSPAAIRHAAMAYK